MEFFNSLTTSIFGGESKVNSHPSSADAQILGNPSSSSSTTTTTTTLPAQNEEEPSNFAQFRQISLPGEWTHDSTDPDSDVGSGRFKFGFESFVRPDDILQEFLSLVQHPIGPQHTFMEACKHLPTSVWESDAVTSAYARVLVAYKNRSLQEKTNDERGDRERELDSGESVFITLYFTIIYLLVNFIYMILTFIEK